MANLRAVRSDNLCEYALLLVCHSIPRTFRDRRHLAGSAPRVWLIGNFSATIADLRAATPVRLQSEQASDRVAAFDRQKQRYFRL